MSELVNRLIARTTSDISRGVTFADGMRHFTDLIRVTLLEIDQKVKRMEELAEKIEARK